MSRLPAYERNLALERAGGDPQRADRYLQLLLDMLDGYRTGIADARREGQWERIQQSAHRLAGASMYCAATALGDRASRLDDALRNSRYADVGELVDALIREMTRLENTARDVIQQHTAMPETGDDEDREK